MIELLMMSVSLLLIGRAYAVWRYGSAFARPSQPVGEEPEAISEISVIIPLKGWDASLPALISSLLAGSFEGAVEVILMIDEEHPKRSLLPRHPHLSLRSPPPRPVGWHDKNWRLYQGVLSAQYSSTLFLDSDVLPTPSLLLKRCQAHSGQFSFCLPIYLKPRRLAERFLSTFTSLNNLFLYGVGFAIAPPIETAIGPSMLSTSPREVFLESLIAASGSIADDHALAYQLSRRGVVTHLAYIPVAVGKDGEGWREVGRQIIRWLTLPRTVTDQLTPRLLGFASCALTLNSVSIICLWVGGVCALCDQDGAKLLSLLGFYTALLDGVLLAWVEREWARRLGSPPQAYTQLLFTPLTLLFVLISLPVFWLIGGLKREIKWRGEVTLL